MRKGRKRKFRVGGTAEQGMKAKTHAKGGGRGKKFTNAR